MNPNEIAEVLSRHVEAENAHDMARTLATLHRECLFEDVPMGKVYQGHAGAAVYYRKWWDAFGLKFYPGAEGKQHFTADGMIAEGRFAGTHIGPFEGLQPTMRKVDFRFVVVVGFRDGLMAGERFYYDRAALEDQLGVAIPR